MSQLLEGKTALVLGVANRWSLAYAIAQAFQREGARLLLTYQGERLQKTVEELGASLGAARVFECDVTRDEDLAKLTRRWRPKSGWMPWCTALRSRIQADLSAAVRRNFARWLSAGAECQRVFDGRRGARDRSADDERRRR